MNQPLLYEMRLVGGTSLALQYGHRRSVDDFGGMLGGNVLKRQPILISMKSEELLLLKHR